MSDQPDLNDMSPGSFNDRVGNAEYFIKKVILGEDNAMYLLREPAAEYRLSGLWQRLDERKRSHLVALAKCPPHRNYEISAHWVCMTSMCCKRLHAGALEGIRRALPLLDEARRLKEEQRKNEGGEFRQDESR